MSVVRTIWKNIVTSGINMTELSNEIFRRWGHSFEESTNEITVYRPADYDFPRARGRAAIEFRPDGTFIDWVIGPGDARRGVNGHWQIEVLGSLRISFEDRVRPSRILDILQCDAEILRVQQRPATL